MDFIKVGTREYSTSEHIITFGVRHKNGVEDVYTVTVVANNKRNAQVKVREMAEKKFAGARIVMTINPNELELNEAQE